MIILGLFVAVSLMALATYELIAIHYQLKALRHINCKYVDRTTQEPVKYKGPVLIRICGKSSIL